MYQREIDVVKRHSSGHFCWVSFELHSNSAGSCSQADNKTAKYQELEKTYSVHLLSGRHWDSRLMESAGHRTGAGDRQTHLSSHWHNSETAFLLQRLRSATLKCGFILKHFFARLIRRI